MKISLEVHKSNASFGVTVLAESVQQAVDLVGERCPGSGVRVALPINPKNIFGKDSAARAGISGFEGLDVMAA